MIGNDNIRATVCSVEKGNNSAKVIQILNLVLNSRKQPSNLAIEGISTL